MTDDRTWDFRDPASKGRLLDILQRSHAEMIELASDPDHWHSATACPGWELRDMIGHLVDAIEGYLSGFDAARRGITTAEAIGVARMAAAADEAARAFRTVPRDELLIRFRDKAGQLLDDFEALSEGEWTQLLVRDPYLGPLPAMVVAAGLLGGYTVHGWDVREGLGRAHAIAEDAADMLVPFVFLVWQATADTSALDAPYTVGIRTTGRNGGDRCGHVTHRGVRFEAGAADACHAMLEFDPGTLVLSAYNRINGGTVHGDRDVAANFRALFVAI